MNLSFRIFFSNELMFNVHSCLMNEKKKTDLNIFLDGGFGGRTNNPYFLFLSVSICEILPKLRYGPLSSHDRLTVDHDLNYIC